MFIGADKAFYLDKEDKEWRYINDPIHIGFPTSKNSKEKQTFNTGMINIIVNDVNSFCLTLGKRA